MTNMQFRFANHRKNSESFFLNTHRLIFREVPTPKPTSEMEKANQADQMARQALGKKMAEVKSLVEADTDDKLAIDYTDPQSVVAAIQRVAALIEQSPKPQGWAGRHLTGKQSRIDMLTGMKTALEGYQTALKQFSPAQTRATELSGAGLVKAGTEITDMVKERGELMKQMPYQQAEAEYKMAVEGVLSGSDFKNLVDKPGEGFSEITARENKELFFSILANQTENFKDACLMGPDFTEDPAANAEKFPFIFKEWMKIKGSEPQTMTKDPNRLDANKLKVVTQEMEHNIMAAEAVKREIAAQGNPALEIGIGDQEFAGVSVLMGTPEIQATGVANSLATLVTVKRDADFYMGANSAINGMVYEFKRLRGKAVDVDENARKTKKPRPANNNTSLAPAPAKTPVDPLINTYSEVIRKLELYQKYAKAQEMVQRSAVSKEGDEVSFTRANLSKGKNRQIVMELLLKQFEKAMKMVDDPYASGGRYNDLNPAVRRLMIATIFKNGVSAMRFDPQFKNENGTLGAYVYMDNITDDYKWMRSKLMQSPLFNTTERTAHLSQDQRDFIWIARIGNLALLDSKHINNELQDLNKAKALLASKAPFGTFRNDLQNKTPAEIDDRIKKTEALRDLYAGFTQKTEKYMTNPYGAESVQFLKDARDPNGPYATIIKDKNAGEELKNIDLKYNMMDFNEKSTMRMLDKYGISVELTYQHYNTEVAKNPDMVIGRWNDYLLSGDKAKFDKLLGFLGKIVENNQPGGKEKFLRVMATMQGFQPSATTPAHSADQMQAYEIYQLIKLHIQGEGGLYANSDRSRDELMNRINGMTVGDKISEYVKGVLNMAIGPGQSVANRAAGIALLLVAYKAAKRAYGNDKDPTSKALRALFVGGALELAAKGLTGKGMLERLGLHTVAAAAEGTFEAALVQRGHKHMEGDLQITDEQHTAALLELNRVPFGKVLEWYETSDDNGQPRVGAGGGKTADKFPSGINLGTIYKGIDWNNKNQVLMARRIVHETVKNFLEYVGNKNQRDSAYGLAALKERYIEAVKPGFDLKKAQYSLHVSELLQGMNPNVITWQLVMRAEIDPDDVAKTVGQNLVDRSLKVAKDAAAGVGRFTREQVLPGVMAYSSEFYNYVGAKATDVQKYLGEVAEAGATQLHFTAESVEYWYGNHKYQIRKFVGDHVELVVEGAKLPFEILYGLDRMAVPYVTTKLRQGREIFRWDKQVNINRDLLPQDIMSNEIITAIQTLPAADRAEAAKYILPDIQNNKEFTYYGIYQEPFARALRSGEVKDARGKVTGYSGEKYYETKSKAEAGSMENVAFFISETTQAEAGIDPKDTSLSSNDRANLMESRAHDQAKATFLSKNPSLQGNPDLIDKYMYPIHHIVVGGTATETAPKKIYTFWRMPLPGSPEFQMKEAGRWADYMDPNDLKNRPPFMVDPKKTPLQNLKLAFANDVGPITRESAKLAGKIVAQWPRVLLGVKNTVSKLIPARFTAWKNMMKVDPKTDQEVDEYMTSAEWGVAALSDYYKNEKNTKTYSEHLDFKEFLPPGTPLYLPKTDRAWKGKRVSTQFSELPKMFKDEKAYMEAFKMWWKSREDHKGKDFNKR